MNGLTLGLRIRVDLTRNCHRASRQKKPGSNQREFMYILSESIPIKFILNFFSFYIKVNISVTLLKLRTK